MADQKKLFLTLFGVILILGGLILGSYGIERHYAAKQEFSSTAQSIQNTAYISGGIALVFIVVGGILLKIRKKHIVVPE